MFVEVFSVFCSVIEVAPAAREMLVTTKTGSFAFVAVSCFAGTDGVRGNDARVTEEIWDEGLTL